MVVLESAARFVVPLRRRVARAAPLLGPAFVAAIAYVDPGNFATNFTAGAHLGYRLAWVIVAANLVALLIQSLSAKLGLVTGYGLARLCRDRMPRPLSRVLWVQAELVAMATDLAEIVGGAVALNLLLGVPLPVGGLITCGVALLLVSLHERGVRRFEAAIGGLLGVILLGFLYQLIRSGVDPAGLAAGMVPSLTGPDTAVLATAILGATVMPHVIYLHSELATGRPPGTDPRVALRGRRTDTVVALGLAGLVNLSMLLIAAKLFAGDTGMTTLEDVHAGLAAVLDHWAALAFALALLIAGFASSGVGTYAGQVIMRGFLNRDVPLTVRRLVTMAPAMAVLVLGADPTTALVWSQVMLSFGVPFALIPLIWLTARKDVMGEFVNRWLTTVVAGAAVTVIIALNAVLVGQVMS